MKIRKILDFIKDSYTSKVERFKKIFQKYINSGKMNTTIDTEMVLNSFLNTLFDAFLASLKPVVGSIDLLRKKHKDYLINREIEALSKKKEKLVMAIMNASPEEISYESYTKVSEKFKEIIENPEFEENFKRIDKLFQDLNPEEQINLLNNTGKNIHKMILEIRDDISTKLIETSDKENMLILGQAFRCVDFLIRDLIESTKRKKHIDDEHISFCLNYSAVLLSKILAIYFNKINYDALYSDIAFITFYTHINNPHFLNEPKEVDDSLFTILGAEI